MLTPEQMATFYPNWLFCGLLSCFYGMFLALPSASMLLVIRFVFRVKWGKMGQRGKMGHLIFVPRQSDPWDYVMDLIV